MSERESHPRAAKELDEAAPAQRSQEELDELLDEALAGTFPASDPIELSSFAD